MASKTKKDPDAIYSTRARVSLRKFLLDKYTWKGKKKLVAYLFSDNFQNRIRAKAHAGVDNEYICPFCDGSGLALSDAEYKKLQDQLAKFGEVKIPEVVAKSLQSIMNIDAPTAFNMVNEFKNYSLLSILYHSPESKLHRVYGIRSKIRKKTEANYKQIVNGVDIKALTYKDIEKDIKEITDIYGKMLIPCPACLGFGYLDVGHEDPQGKVVKMLQFLYAEYKKNPKKRMRISTMWNRYYADLKIHPQIAERPTTAWASKNEVIFSKLSQTEHGEIVMANRFKAFTNSIKAAIKAELARIKSLIEKNEISEDDEAVTFEESIKFYEKLIRFSRVSTGTLRKKLKDELATLKTRYTEAQDDDTLKITRNGEILHALPERFLWVQGATQEERRESGVAKVWRTKKGKRVLTNLNPIKSKESTKPYNKFRIYAAFLSDDPTYGYGTYTWGKGGQTITSLLRSVGIGGKQLKFVKVFPQILAD